MPDLERSETQPTLREDFVLELIAPFDAQQPYGRAEGLSGYIYRQMIVDGSADMMVSLIDMTETYLETDRADDVDNELNQDKILRLLAIIGDMPDEIPEDERLRAWEHALDADWLHMYGDDFNLENVLQHVRRQQPDFVPLLSERLRLVLDRKNELFESMIGFSEAIPRVSIENHDFNATMNGYSRVRDSHPETLMLYHSIVLLSRLSAHF